MNIKVPVSELIERLEAALANAAPAGDIQPELTPLLPGGTPLFAGDSQESLGKVIFVPNIPREYHYSYVLTDPAETNPDQLDGKPLFGADYLDKLVYVPTASLNAPQPEAAFLKMIVTVMTFFGNSFGTMLNSSDSTGCGLSSKATKVFKFELTGDSFTLSPHQLETDLFDIAAVGDPADVIKEFRIIPAGQRDNKFMNRRLVEAAQKSFDHLRLAPGEEVHQKLRARLRTLFSR